MNTNICILGVTGSIGTQTLDVIRNHRDDFSLLGITANKSYNGVIEIIEEFAPPFVAMMDRYAFEKVKEYCEIKGKGVEVFLGMEGMNKIATLQEVETVVTSVVGMVGLEPTLNAIKAGKNIALANKETLVVAGEMVMEAAKKHHVKILPVDSEHSAIFQSLQGNNKQEINKILLTASGGPFRGRRRRELQGMRASEALKHPKWNMGKKISIDSSTLMNKGLEVIEAHWLFGVPYEDITVVIHPQSVIHSMVEYTDGSIIAQLASADMRLPIQYALYYPERRKRIVSALNFYEMEAFTFEKPDMETFKCLQLAYEAGKTGGSMPAVLNAANEIAVEYFLQDQIGLLDIEAIVEECMISFPVKYHPTLEDIQEIDSKVREFAVRKCSN